MVRRFQQFPTLCCNLGFMLIADCKSLFSVNPSSVNLLVRYPMTGSLDALKIAEGQIPLSICFNP